MATPLLEIRTTPPDLLQRMSKYPAQLDGVMRKTMEASILHLQASVPGYPPPPPNSNYRRTGQLGRSLGVAQEGGTIGPPSIKAIRKVGPGYEGIFGTNLNYAPDVIGEGTQKAVHAGRWWTMKTVADRAREGVVKLYQVAADRMAAWLDGR